MILLPMARPRTEVEAAEAWLDQLDPDTVPARDATHVRAVADARRAVTEAEEALLDAVRAARTAGDSWNAIGIALGVTRQRAHQRYAHLIEE